MARVRAEPSGRAARHRRRHLAGRLANGRALSHLARGQGHRRRGEREKRQPGHKARKQGRRVLAVPASPDTDQLIISGATPVKIERKDWGELVARIVQSLDATTPGNLRQASLWQ